MRVVGDDEIPSETLLQSVQRAINQGAPFDVQPRLVRSHPRATAAGEHDASDGIYIEWPRGLHETTFSGTMTRCNPKTAPEQACFRRTQMYPLALPIWMA